MNEDEQRAGDEVERRAADVLAEDVASSLSSGVGVAVGAGLRQRAEGVWLGEGGRRPAASSGEAEQEAGDAAHGAWRRYYAGAPVSAHRRPAKRTPSVSRRTANSAHRPAHTPWIPQSSRSASSASGT